jgi:hypothetical protein
MQRILLSALLLVLPLAACAEPDTAADEAEEAVEEPMAQPGEAVPTTEEPGNEMEVAEELEMPPAGDAEAIVSAFENGLQRLADISAGITDATSAGENAADFEATALYVRDVEAMIAADRTTLDPLLQERGEGLREQAATVEGEVARLRADPAIAQAMSAELEAYQAPTVIN